MRCIPSFAGPGPGRRAAAILLGGLLVAFAAETRGIEMFTFFGDGSRTGLPNLEVPVEAYPGIPLRSDRIRARRRAQRQPTAARSGQLPAGFTIRPMPEARPVPMPRPTQAGRQTAAATARTTRPTAAATGGPSPADVRPPRGASD